MNTTCRHSPEVIEGLKRVIMAELGSASSDIEAYQALITCPASGLMGHIGVHFAETGERFATFDSGDTRVAVIWSAL